MLCFDDLPLEIKRWTLHPIMGRSRRLTGVIDGTLIVARGIDQLWMSVTARGAQNMTVSGDFRPSWPAALPAASCIGSAELLASGDVHNGDTAGQTAFREVTRSRPTAVVRSRLEEICRELVVSRAEIRQGAPGSQAPETCRRRETARREFRTKTESSGDKCAPLPRGSCAP